MKTPITVLIIFTISIASAQSPQMSSDAEAAIRIADADWENAIASRDLEKTLSIYDAEIVTAGTAMPSAQGLPAIKAMWTKYFAMPEFSLSWKADKVMVTESDTIAYSTGVWRGGTQSSDTGPYIAVWRKQPDERWKVLIDAAWNDRLPKPRVPQQSGSAVLIAIQNADEALAKAIAAKSIEETISFYDAETVTAGTWMPSVRGVKAIRERYQKLFAQPGFELSLKIHRLLATESGTIAYTTGIWNMPESAGPYFFLWRKQQDGKYKILIDSAWRARTPE